MLNKPFRLLCLIIALTHLAACAKTATMQPMGVHTTSGAHKMTIKESEQYRVTLRDGREHVAFGNAIHMTDDVISVYSYEEEQWKRYPKAHIEEIDLIVEDRLKKKKRSTLITGLAVLTCFFAVSAGSYFIQKEIRK